MPIYEYQCADCACRFEEIVAHSRIQNPPCPACSSNNTEKRMSRIGAVAMSKGGSGDLACPSGGPCPGASACGSGGCCAGMH